MNILVLSSIYPRPHNPSDGIFVHQQVKHIQKVGCRVTVLSAVPWSPKFLQFRTKWRNYGLTPKETHLDGVQVHYPRYLRLPGAWFRSGAGMALYRSAVLLALNLHRHCAFDLIHSNTLLPDGLAGVYLGRKLNLPTVCTIRGSDAITYPRENYLNLYYSKVTIRQTSQIVTVSRALKRVVEDVLEPPRNIQVVYNGVDVEKFQLTGQKVMLDRPYILFVGRDIQRKGLQDLIRAFSLLMDQIEHNLVIIGPALPEVRQLNPELVEQLGGRLMVLGHLMPDEIPAYIQNSAFLILPSYAEGLPNVVLEAMACAKAVVATKIMGIPEAVLNDVTGLLIHPGDVTALAESILSLANNPARCAEMGKLGREKVVKEFSWECHATKMVSIYQETIAHVRTDRLS
ncbi:MAG: glycosyltransferase [Anaerolineae bacterium]|nr:glycosyltransferase [Anaerolineae bacterium]